MKPKKIKRVKVACRSTGKVFWVKQKHLTRWRPSTANDYRMIPAVDPDSTSYMPGSSKKKVD